MLDQTKRERRVLARPRLLSLIAKVATKRLTTVVAGAGFGKSTLLSVWAEEVDAIIHNLHARDRKVDVLARGLSRALATRLPDVAVVPMTAMADEHDLERADALATWLSETLHSATEDLFIFIDDAHEVSEGLAPARMLEGLVRQAPPSIHIVIGSRTQIPFPIERLRGRGEVLTVDASQLAFTGDEIDELLAGSDLESFSPQIRDVTGGWPAAVSLTLEVLAAAPVNQRTEALASLTTREGPLFSYLAEEVVSSEPPDVRELVRLLVPLERFGSSIAGALGFADGEAAVRDLARRGVLLEPGSHAHNLRVHALARAFFLERFPLTEQEHADVHRRASLWYERTGALEEALRAAVVAGGQDTVGDLLERHGQYFLEHDAGSLAAALTAKPDRSRAEDLLLARARFELGDRAGVVEILGKHTPLDPAAAAILAYSLWHVGEAARAREVLESLDPEDLDGIDRYRAHFVTALASAAKGELVTAIDAGRLAVAAAEEIGDAAKLSSALGTLGNYYGLRGDLATRDLLWDQAVEAARRSTDKTFLENFRIHLAEIADTRGRAREAFEHVDAALRAADLLIDAPAAAARARARALLKRAQLHLRFGRIDEAARDAIEAKEVATRLRLPLLAGALMHLGYIYRARGNLALAIAASDEASREFRALGDPHERLHCDVGTALALASEDAEGAVQRGRRILEELGETPDPEMYADIAWIELVAGSHERARDLATAAMTMARADQQPRFEAEALAVQALASDPPEPALLREAIRLWRAVGDPIGEAQAVYAHARLSGDPAGAEIAVAELEALGVGLHTPPAGILAALPAVEANTVEIRSLGGFAVVRGGRPVSSSEWPSKKARDLLRIMVARRGASTHREILMDLLWPGEEPATLANRFSIELSRVRSVLDPGRLRDGNHFVRLEGDAVTLDLRHLKVDVERFFSEAERASMSGAMEDLMRAEALYGGDFLEDDPYAEWAVAVRERAHRLFVQIESALARAASAINDHIGAIRRNLRIIERDPYDEAAHLGLVGTNIAAGHHGEARRQYREYAKRMRELEIEPVPYPPSSP